MKPAQTKGRLAVPGLDDNQTFRDGLALLKENGNEASAAIKHRTEARRFNQEAYGLGVDYPQQKQRLDGLVAQRNAALGKLEMVEAQLKPLKAQIEALDRDVEERQKAIDAFPKEARRDFTAELAQVDRQRRDAAREADQCRAEGREIPAALVTRSLALEGKRDELKKEEAERAAGFAELRDAAQDQVSRARSSLATSLHSCIDRQSTRAHSLMVKNDVLYGLFPERLLDDVQAFWARAKEAAQIVVHLEGRGIVNDVLERSFWPRFSDEHRVRLENVLLPRRQTVSLPHRPRLSVREGVATGT